MFVPKPSLRSPVFLVLAGALAALTACAEPGVENSATGPETGARAASDVSVQAQEVRAAVRAQERHSRSIMARDGVVGTAVGLDGEGRPSVRVYLLGPEAAPGLPDRVDGVPVTPVVTGMFVARADETSRRRPAPIGFSVGHPDITAGTIGARVLDGSGNVYILSNNHVLADVNQASIGDPTLQPGPTDGGSDPEDRVGTLHDYEPLALDGSVNYIDAGIAATDRDSVDYRTSSEGYGAPSSTLYDLDGTSGIGTISPSVVGQTVQKYGRTTGLTRGEVSEVSVNVNVCYECAGPFCRKCKSFAYFEDQMAITPGDFSDGGDSGSLIVTDDSNASPLGLLFAGSSTRTLANRIDRVVDRFGITVDDGSSDGGSGDTNSAPSASFTSSCTDLSCSFDGSGSSDSDGTIASYEWGFGDGNTGSGVTTSHTYASGGTYTVTLTVTDDEGATDSSSQDVSVSSSDGGGSAGGFHVADLDGAQSNEGSTWTATVTVLVHDDTHTSEGGSTVAFDYVGRDVSGAVSCTTDGQGVCSVSVAGIPKRTGAVDVTVTGVSDADGSYDSGSNHDPDGDSDGTTITVSKP